MLSRPVHTVRDGPRLVGRESETVPPVMLSRPSEVRIT
jgi:hypothetical protein